MGLAVTETNDKVLKEKYIHNRYLLAKDLLGFKDLTTNFHYRYVCRKLQEPRKTSIRMWMLPRGHFKTTILTITDSIALQLQDPSIRIAIISDIKANAESMVSAIGSPYLVNPRFRQFFSKYCPAKPHAPETTWTKSNIEVPNREGKPVMENTFEAFGSDSTLTSRHFDYIKFDDLVTRENSTTRDQMNKIKTFYKSCFPLRDNPTTPMDIIGTRWDDFDLYGEIEEEAKAMAGESNIEIIKIPAHREWEPLFPERYSKQDLLNLRASLGSYLFSCLYMLDPIPQEDAVFKSKFFRYFRLSPDRLMIHREDGVDVPVGDCYMSVDGATEEGRNDYSAVPVACTDHEDDRYVLEVFHKQVDPVDLLDKMIEIYFKWGCIKYAVQKTVIEKMLGSFLKKRLMEEKRYMSAEPLGKNTTQNKEFLIKQMQPWYEAGKVWHNETLRGTELEEELLRFPKAKHDDVIDALQMLFEVLKPSSKVVHKAEYDRNSLHLWKRRLQRAFGMKNFSDAESFTLNTRTY